MLEAALAARVSERRDIIAFRNVQIHRYASANDRLVWGVIEAKLPVLRREIAELAGERTR
jgi:uncharacterized protein with HEPN domain